MPFLLFRQDHLRSSLLSRREWVPERTSVPKASAKSRAGREKNGEESILLAASPLTKIPFARARTPPATHAICGPHRGSFTVRDHLRSNLGIISGLAIICGVGSFAVLTPFGKFFSCFKSYEKERLDQEASVKLVLEPSWHRHFVLSKEKWLWERDWSFSRFRADIEITKAGPQWVKFREIIFITIRRQPSIYWYGMKTRRKFVGANF